MVANYANPTLKAFNGLRITALVLQVLYLIFASIKPNPIIIVILSLQSTLLIINLLNYKSRLEELHLYLFLLFDLVLFMGYIFNTGGTSNPLISLSFLPLIIACLSFPRAWALSLLIVAIGCYSYLLWSQPAHHHMDFNSHLIGMWGVYIVSASLLFLIISKQVSEKRKLDQKLVKLKAKRQRDEHLMSLGLANADMAHQLNTPLASLVLIGENLSTAIEDTIENESAKQYLQADLNLMHQQLHICQHISNEHLSKWQQDNLENNKQELRLFIETVAKDFRLMRSETRLELDVDSCQKNILITRGLKYALLNLLNNAASASLESEKDNILLSAKEVHDKAIISIKDYGKGLSEDIKSLYGYQPNPESNSMGVGSLLVTANLERAGASMEIVEGADESNPFGTEIIVKLPITDGGN